MSSLAMKNPLMLPLLLVSTLMLRAQVDPLPPPALPPRAPSQPFGAAPLEAPPTVPRYPGFTTFNINFPGGPPSKLVQMITNQTHKPLNVIIPPDYADTELPPLNLYGVTVPQLFDALEQASKRKVTYTYGPALPNAYQSYQQGTTGFGFNTANPRSEDSIWYFYVASAGEPPKPAPPPPPQPAPSVCRFFQLGPYLQAGVKVEDITTAIETAWKMLGENTTPKIKFHQDTKLLIAVGQVERLMVIDEVLEKLPGGPVQIDSTTGLPKRPAELNVNPPESNVPKPLKP
jgi:hypothetical protein